MGGSGGTYFRSEPEKLKRRLRESEEHTENVAVESFIESLLPKINDRDVEAINRHLDEIKAALEKELDGTVRLPFGGSVAKHTYVDGLSDVDSLVILDNCELADQPPLAAKEYFARRLRERFSKTKVETGTLAVTIHFSDVEIQLLPAISCKNHVKIADQTGNTWLKINPKAFSEALTRVNAKKGGKVVPVIKLAKAINDNLPKKHRISGYHTEALAVKIFRDYHGKLRPKAMLKHFFQEASRLVIRPIRDRTGQSDHVDDYLGPRNSLERRIVRDAFSRVSRRMDNADHAGSVDEWRKLFGQ